MFLLVIMNKGHEQIWKMNKEEWEGYTTNYIKYALPIIKKNKVEKILDLGCGPCEGGAFLLKEKKYDVYAFDASKTAIKKCSKKIEKKKLTIGNMYEKLPYENNFFDCVICFQAINHGTLKEIRNCFSEISRILKKNGLFFLTTSSRDQIKKRKDYFIDLEDGKKWTYSEKNNSFTPLTGTEKGIKHYFFKRKEMKKEIEKIFIIQKMTEMECMKHFIYAKNKKKYN